MKKLVLIFAILLWVPMVLAHSITTQLQPSSGKVGHGFESNSSHSFYLHNEDSVVHVYQWLIKQCPMYNGKPEVCPENGGGKLTLQPGQSFQFSKNLTMHLKCGANAESISTYAMSSLESDNLKDKYLKQEALSHATCK